MDIQPYINTLKDCIQDSNSSFGHLDKEQLNWKPNAKAWSIAQCLDHILVTNEAYEFNFTALASGQKKNTFWENLGLFSGIVANLLKKTVNPENVKKANTPRLFLPSQSDLPATILTTFEEGIGKQINYFEAFRNLNHEKERVTTPISPMISFRLSDAVEIITMHTVRHLNQAKRLLSEIEKQ